MTVVSSGIRTISRLGLAPICGLGKSQTAKTRLGGRVLKQPIGVGFMYFFVLENDMSHPKNTTGSPVAQDSLTTEVEFCETPISNQGTEMLKVAAGIECRDAVEKARALSSGLGQICKHMHDAVNYGDLVCCDGLETLSFVAEAISALLWSVQRGLPSKIAEREQA